MSRAHILALVTVLVAGATSDACSRTSTRVTSAVPRATPSPAPGTADPNEIYNPCADPGDIMVFASPEHPYGNAPLRVIAVTSHPVAAELNVSQSDGTEVTSHERHGATPYYWLLSVDAPREGTWRAQLRRTGTCGTEPLQAREVHVEHGPAGPTWVPPSALWSSRAEWSPSFENLYSAWVEHLFDAPTDSQPSWTALREVLRDPTRNFLFGHLSPHEDDGGFGAAPDCADLPYVLRAYFAYKLGLPFGWSHCSRGEGGAPPHCSAFATSGRPFPPSTVVHLHFPRGLMLRAREGCRTQSDSPNSFARR